MFSYQQNFFTPTQEVDRERFWALVGAPYTKELIDGVRAFRAEAAKIEAAGIEDELPKAEDCKKQAAALKRKLRRAVTAVNSSRMPDCRIWLARISSIATR